MALSASELPIIDLSKEAMKPGTRTWDLTCKHVRKALEEYGCFVATFNEINNELHSAFFSSLEKFFDLPEDTKRRYVPVVPFTGYSSDSPLSPLGETMGLIDPLSFQTIHNLTLSMWPQGNDTFCETLHTYVTRVSELEKIVTKVIFQSYGLEKLYETDSEPTDFYFRLMKYGAPMKDEDTRAMSMHHDKNFMTIVQADGVGLQVQSRDGKLISVTPSASASSLVVIMGESFYGWSNGRIRCPPHRVRMSGYKSRYSMGLFANKKSTVKIPSELVDDEHPLLFKPFDHASLAKIYMQQMMDKAFNGDDDNIVPTLDEYFSV